MGLIKEPKNVEFTVLDKQWTKSELLELSAFIKISKEKKKKKKIVTTKTQRKRLST